MNVSAWWGGSKGSKVYGIRVGETNQKKYFNRSLTEAHTEVRIEMDGVTQTFTLSHGFWGDCPEIKDRGEPIIKNWLQKHKILKRPECHPPWPLNNPPKMELIKLSMNKFKLEPVAIIG